MSEEFVSVFILDYVIYLVVRKTNNCVFFAIISYFLNSANSEILVFILSFIVFVSYQQNLTYYFVICLPFYHVSTYFKSLIRIVIHVHAKNCEKLLTNLMMA